MSITSINNTNLKGIKSSSFSESKFKGFAIEYLVVAGGGGGGSGEANTRAGGGGAGGFVNSFGSESSGGGGSKDMGSTVSDEVKNGLVADDPWLQRKLLEEASASNTSNDDALNNTINQVSGGSSSS